MLRWGDKMHPFFAFSSASNAGLIRPRIIAVKVCMHAISLRPPLVKLEWFPLVWGIKQFAFAGAEQKAKRESLSALSNNSQQKCTQKPPTHSWRTKTITLSRTKQTDRATKFVSSGFALDEPPTS